MLNFCILNSNYSLRTFELKFLLFHKIRLIIVKTINILIIPIILKIKWFFSSKFYSQIAVLGTAQT